jgi:arylsulfatase A-like enzyme
MRPFCIYPYASIGCRLLDRLTKSIGMSLPPEPNASEFLIETPMTFYGRASRAAFAALILLTSIYCLLAYLPFTYFNVVKFPMFRWVSWFERFYPLLYGTFSGAVCLSFQRQLRVPKTKRIIWAFIFLNVLVTVALSVRNVVAQMPNDERSLIAGFAVFLPLLWLTAIDFSSVSGKRTLPATSDSFSILTPVIAAAFVWMVYTALSFSSNGLAQNVEIRPFMLRLTIGNLILLMLLTVSVWASFDLIPRVSRTIESRAILTASLAGILGALVLHRIVLQSLAINSRYALLYSLFFSFSTALFAVSLWIKRREDDRVRTMGSGSRSRMLFSLGAIALGAYLTTLNLKEMDWDSVLEELSVIAVLAAALVVFKKGESRNKTASRRVPTAALGALAAGAAILCGAQSFLWPAGLHMNAASSQALLDLYAQNDLSFGVVHRLLSSPFSAAEHEDLYRFLVANTNVTAPVPPADLHLVDSVQLAAYRPNIFVIVIDSLRRDYVSLYNPAVDFTPQVARFGRDSIVMENAFSRYAGTSLAEASIWTGTMQLHKEFIQPFYPMNNLERLIDGQGYRSFITDDPILKQLLNPTAQFEELDKTAAYWTDYDLGNTLKELEQKLDANKDKQSQRPIFLYTQAQNVHQVSIFRHRSVPRRAYPGFNEKYASELEKLDKGFGEFLDYLEQQGLYENSIIVLTSDHGDSFGELGRLGHQAVAPETIRIPLIIHLPKSLRDHMYWDTKTVAFSLDITPTLCYLLGERSIVRNELFGRPLFTLTKQEHDDWIRPNYLVASSYAPIYGILSDSGRKLFVADASRRSAYFYDLAEDPKRARNHLTPSIFDENERLLKAGVNQIRSLYGVDATEHAEAAPQP